MFSNSINILSTKLFESHTNTSETWQFLSETMTNWRIKANSHRHAGHDTALSRRVWLAV